MKVKNNKKTISFIFGNSLLVWFLTAFAIFIFVIVSNNDSVELTSTNDLKNSLNQSQKGNVTENTGNDENNEDSDYYEVIKVVDGDTIKVDIKGKIETIRLIGIDTPESVDPRRPVECFGKEASIKLEELVLNKKVKLEADSTQADKDQFDRLLRYIYLEDGTNINEKMILYGFAFEFTYDLPYKFQEKFIEAENQAITNSIGLWDKNYCPDY